MRPRGRGSEHINPNNSITEVAALANVSTATVSRVLSGRRKKDDDIARRVRDAAQKLHYSANPAASSLRSDITNIIAAVIAQPIDSFSANLVTELESKARESGKYLLISTGKKEDELEERLQMLLERGVDGIVIVPGPRMDLSPALAQLAEEKTPIIQISGKSTSTHINWIGVDVATAMQEAITHLTDHNGTSIMFLNPQIDTDNATDALVTFQYSDQITGYLHEPRWITFGECTLQRGYDDILKTFQDDNRDRPNAILCGSDEVAAGAIMALRQLGISVPDEVNVIGYGDTLLATSCRPSITSLRPPYEEMAQEALRLIELKRSGKRHLPSHTAFAPQVIRRESTSSPRIGTSDMADPR